MSTRRVGISPQRRKVAAKGYAVVYPWIKRGVDVVVSSALLVLCAPLFLLLAICVWASMGSPVLFRQRRLGYKNRVFTLFKFRSMADTRDAQGTLLPDAERLTPVGRFLRKTSLDELPQLWNVLRGDMSLVGPRPLLVEYWDVYTPREKTRQNVRPGITGLAQVHGRNQSPWNERLEWDARYVERMSPGLDAYILWRTIWKVLARSDVDFPNQENLPLTHYRRASRETQP